MFKAGIEKNVQQRRAAAESAAAAEAAKKAGIMGKAKNVFGGSSSKASAGGVAVNGLGECLFCFFLGWWFLAGWLAVGRVEV